jgi:hypothetical protein
MSKHKTKIFKAVFLNNSDCYADTTPKETCIPAMTEETFVPLMGQMWSKAKAKYKKRNERDTTPVRIKIKTGNTRIEADAIIKEMQMSPTRNGELTLKITGEVSVA